MKQTGITDKNGLMIYEGDTVRLKSDCYCPCCDRHYMQINKTFTVQFINGIWVLGDEKIPLDNYRYCVTKI